MNKGNKKGRKQVLRPSQLGNGTEGTKTLGINTPAKVKDLGGVELVGAGLLFSFAGSK